MGYNVVSNPIEMLHNVPIASAPGKELLPPILSTLAIHGVQVKRERSSSNHQNVTAEVFTKN